MVKVDNLLVILPGEAKHFTYILLHFWEDTSAILFFSILSMKPH